MPSRATRAGKVLRFLPLTLFMILYGMPLKLLKLQELPAQGLYIQKEPWPHLTAQ